MAILTWTRVIMIKYFDLWRFVLISTFYAYPYRCFEREKFVYRTNICINYYFLTKYFATWHYPNVFTMNVWVIFLNLNIINSLRWTTGLYRLFIAAVFKPNPLSFFFRIVFARLVKVLFVNWSFIIIRSIQSCNNNQHKTNDHFIVNSCNQYKTSV